METLSRHLCSQHGSFQDAMDQIFIRIKQLLDEEYRHRIAILSPNGRTQHAIKQMIHRHGRKYIRSTTSYTPQDFIVTMLKQVDRKLFSLDWQAHRDIAGESSPATPNTNIDIQERFAQSCHHYINALESQRIDPDGYDAIFVFDLEQFSAVHEIKRVLEKYREFGCEINELTLHAHRKPTTTNVGTIDLSKAPWEQIKSIVTSISDIVLVGNTKVLDQIEAKLFPSVQTYRDIGDSLFTNRFSPKTESYCRQKYLEFDGKLEVRADIPFLYADEVPLQSWEWSRAYMERISFLMTLKAPSAFTPLLCDIEHARYLSGIDFYLLAEPGSADSLISFINSSLSIVRTVEVLSNEKAR